MKDPAYYKKRLEEERDALLIELERIAFPDPENPENWVLKVPDMDIMEADQNEAADRTEEIHIDSIVLDELEGRYRLILHALRKFDTGTYGICEESGVPIEEDRLDANPAARTCKKHLGATDERAL
jgi:RNA polymerase-binding transcription factor DksA